MLRFIKRFLAFIILTVLTMNPSTLYSQENIESTVNDQRLDHPHETGWLFSVAPSGDDLQPATAWRDDIYDYTNAKKGDFSLSYTVDDPDLAGVFGFTPGRFIDTWKLNSPSAVAFWFRIDGEINQDSLKLYLVNDRQNRAVAGLKDIEPDGQWHKVNIPFNEFEQESGFQSERIKSIQVEVDLETGSKIGFDDVRYISLTDQQKVTGVTDKTIEQRMREERETRELRISNAFAEMSENGSDQTLYQLFAKLWLGRDLQQVNSKLYNIFTTEDTDIIEKYSIHDDWSLSLNPMLLRMYFLFGSKSDHNPGRLEPRTEEALLELLWKRMERMNDIHLTKQSTWWLIGSENHDINGKVTALLSSQIFMNEPQYAVRVYPNKGTGGAYGYWFHQMYGQGLDNKGPEGNGDWSDGKEYTAEDHYEAWVDFWNEYLTERARKGFFLEVASSGYMRHTIGFLQNIYDFTDDAALKKRIDMFFDLIWSEWAQDQLGAVRGGAKTRWRTHGFDSMWEAARFYLGGPGNAESWYTQLISDYEWTEIIWRIVLNREEKEEYAYTSRKPGEEQPELWPRPGGLERTLAVDTEARFLRYSWVTPDYILGTQMDHPAAIHSHLSAAARWQGMSFASDFSTSVSPAGIVTTNEQEWQRERHAYYRSIQHENVLITQQNRRWFQQNPQWYPTYDIYDRVFGIHFDGDFDRLEEQDGWIFVQVGDAYLAVRSLMGEYQYDHESWSDTGTDEMLSVIREDTYEWGPNREFVKLEDNYSPIIMEAGRRSVYSTLEEFKEYIFAKRLELQKTVVPGWYIVVYGEGTDASPEIYFNASNNEIPKINGTYVDYAPGFTFDSPFIHSDYNSGTITLQVDGMKEILDFNEP